MLAGVPLVDGRGGVLQTFRVQRLLESASYDTTPSAYEYLWDKTAAVEAIYLIWRELQRCTGSGRVSRCPRCFWIPAKHGRLHLSPIDLSSFVYSTRDSRRIRILHKNHTHSALSHLDIGSNQSSFAFYLLNTLRCQRVLLARHVFLHHGENPFDQKVLNMWAELSFISLMCYLFDLIIFLFLQLMCTSHVQPALLCLLRYLLAHNQSVMCLKRRDCAGLCLLCFSLMQAT